MNDWGELTTQFLKKIFWTSVYEICAAFLMYGLKITDVLIKRRIRLKCFFSFFLIFPKKIKEAPGKGDKF